MAGDSEFAYKMIIFSIVIMVALPLMINVFIPSMDTSDAESIMDDYYKFTGASGPTSEAVWVLTGIYTPYQGDLYNYTEDGWLFGSRISSYSPSQYADTLQDFTVYRDDEGIYRYLYDSADYNESTGTGHKGHCFIATADSEGYDSSEDHPTETNYASGETVERKYLGDIYTSVVFEYEEKSDIFFSSSGKHNSSGDSMSRTDTGPFFYDFSGWRYSFQPTSDYSTVNADGVEVDVVATTTSLSLIWYYYYTANGIAGQLVLSGSDYGVAYLSGDQIVKAFDSTTSTAKFAMTFNGVDMNVYVRIDPSKLSSGITVKDCYDQGYWSIMVTSLATDIDAYMGTDYSLDIWNLFDTLVDLLTFDYSDYGMSSFMGAVCSFIIVIPLYAGLISLAMGSWQAMAVVAGVGVIEGLVTAIKNLGIGGWFKVIDPDFIQASLTILGMG